MKPLLWDSVSVVHNHWVAGICWEHARFDSQKSPNQKTRKRSKENKLTTKGVLSRILITSLPWQSYTQNMINVTCWNTIMLKITDIQTRRKLHKDELWVCWYKHGKCVKLLYKRWNFLMETWCRGGRGNTREIQGICYKVRYQKRLNK